MKEQFYDLSFEVLEDGTIRMEQGDHSGESVIVDAHPQQIIHIARNVSAARRTQPNASAERIGTLERRLRWLRDRFEEAYAALPSDLYERCADASEFYTWLQASIDVATEYCADLMPAAPEARESPKSVPEQDPAANNKPFEGKS